MRHQRRHNVSLIVCSNLIVMGVSRLFFFFYHWQWIWRLHTWPGSPRSTRRHSSALACISPVKAPKRYQTIRDKTDNPKKIKQNCARHNARGVVGWLCRRVIVWTCDSRYLIRPIRGIDTSWLGSGNHRTWLWCNKYTNIYINLGA